MLSSLLVRLQCLGCAILKFQLNISTTSLLVPHFTCHYTLLAVVSNTITVDMNAQAPTNRLHVLSCYKEIVLVRSAVVKRFDCVHYSILLIPTSLYHFSAYVVIP